MLKACIENIYPFAHEIIIIEGAIRYLNRDISHYWDGEKDVYINNGKSSDNTISVIKNISDPQNKIQLIKSNGVWEDGISTDHTPMCNIYSKLATGDYIWHVDNDEFFKHDDIIKIIDLLESKNPDTIHFFANHFFGDFNHCIDERGDGVWGNNIPWKRIFRHIPNKSYFKTWEPPDYIYNRIRCESGKIIDKYSTLKLGIKMYHYSYVARTQAAFKDMFFNESINLKQWDNFQIDKNTKAHGSTVYKFEGEHPKIIRDYYQI
jgi:hypothetical protein